MTPTCMCPGCDQEVSRVWPSEAMKRSYRHIDGSFWRTYCSTECKANAALLSCQHDVSQAPKCLGPGCLHRVRRVSPSQASGRDYRFIDGANWRSYCSLECKANAQSHFVADGAGARAEMAEWVREIQGRRVTGGELVDLLCRAERMGYERGAGLRRARKEAAA